MKISRWIVVACAAWVCGAPAWALYKVVGPDGKVTYTDRPPVGNEAGKAVPLDAMGRVAPADNALPFALRSVASRFPVTLYTVPSCQPCDRGRDLLRQRGVPFQERTATNEADRQAWQQQFNTAEAPVLTIGSQQMRGLQADQWNSYLDAAGYPRDSRLPSTYSPPAPQPLTDHSAAADERASVAKPSAPPPPPPPPASGIRF